MSKVIEIKGVRIGEGMPKICVPIVGETLNEIIEEANYLKNIDFDIVEWRADFYQDITSIDKVKKALQTIRTILPYKPIIFTFRSAKEGGARDVSKEFYFELNKSIIKTELIDAVDIELWSDENHIKHIVCLAHENRIAVIISSHDFEKTPSKEEIISKLLRASELGGDIAKIGVMPTCTQDVITLLDATFFMKEEHEDISIITISMAGAGIISRFTGELFGSVITFGSTKKPSAPGQISVEDLRRSIQILHDNMNNLY